MNRYFTLIPLFLLASAALAQDQVKVGDVVDLEERVLIKKMADELSKPNPNAPPPPPPSVTLRKPPKIVYRTEALAVYGTSATFYEGQLSMGGKTYTVRNGTPVQDYVVTSVAPQGIELSKNPAGQRGGRASAKAQAKQTLFAPIATH